MDRTLPRLVPAHTLSPELWVSLDSYIDTAGLRALDEPLTTRLRALCGRHPRWRSRFSIRSTRGQASETKPRTLYLTHKPGRYEEQMRDQHGWKPTPAARMFEDLLAFIATLPFQHTGRIMVIFDDTGLSTPAHADHDDPRWRQEFIWLRPNLVKRLFLQTRNRERMAYLEGYSAWFDTHRALHGVEGREGFAMSIRVDGEFTPELRAALGWTTPGA